MTGSEPSDSHPLSSHAVSAGCQRMSSVAEPLLPATFESGQASVHYAVSSPRNYTSRYAYPLIVWFHDDGGDERDVLDWVPHFSPQNYLGLGLRGPLPVNGGLPGQRRWSTGFHHLEWIEDQLAVALFETCQRLSIHCERIVVAGIGRGGTLALQMMLRRPDLFAAAACLNADLESNWRLDCWGRYSGRHVWLGQSELLPTGGARPAITAARTLHAAGLHVTPRPYAPDEWPLDQFGRELDLWLMQTLCAETVIT